MDHDLDYHFEQIIRGIGEDVGREGLVKTPERAARAFEYLTQGYQQSLSELVNGALFESDSDEMVIVRDIEFYSLCEHHMLPFIGRAQVGYIPNGRVLGLSKIARIVDMYARRLQIQEKLTRDVAEAVLEVTGAKGVAVQMDARHLCMMMRGVNKQNSEMSTSVMLGSFRTSQSTRNEFLQLIRR
ncbi:GTP cyclohydrolase I FolE [Sediminicurvatus halobius]|uniref:GTP cyclohydrolase 1 n=1 Tax=Sediminicurvatus halobius TaxID=2182432 RepID=A0A2U2N1R4_9GAMM|nr:GTP cyclohydrolase I FolE [Spiribacter halobius]PWG62919.1 GTP cyclohydrolase I FolE [Spiribacter halobius]UEX77429.1 GTP cyclohydrolase I FolE [Spiribacter halobius]